jgi:hypothetical protein
MDFEGLILPFYNQRNLLQITRITMVRPGLWPGNKVAMALVTNILG